LPFCLFSAKSPLVIPGFHLQLTNCLQHLTCCCCCCCCWWWWWWYRNDDVMMTSPPRKIRSASDGVKLLTRLHTLDPVMWCLEAVLRREAASRQIFTALVLVLSQYQDTNRSLVLSYRRVLPAASSPKTTALSDVKLTKYISADRS